MRPVKRKQPFMSGCTYLKKAFNSSTASMQHFLKYALAKRGQKKRRTSKSGWRLTELDKAYLLTSDSGAFVMALKREDSKRDGKRITKNHLLDDRSQQVSRKKTYFEGYLPLLFLWSQDRRDWPEWLRKEVFAAHPRRRR